MTNTVTIYCGVPGSGKSTLARAHRDAKICSADHFFENADGDYNFSPALLPEAHAACLKKFVDAITRWPINRPEDLVVDNTNTTVAEIAPYAALALAYCWDLDIVFVKCDPEIAAGRCVHGVPKKAILAMGARLQETYQSLPPWWPRREVQP